MRTKDPIHVGAVLKQVPGKWVALKAGELVEVQESLDSLLEALKKREIKGATVMRSPGEHEPLLVGLG